MNAKYGQAEIGNMVGEKDFLINSVSASVKSVQNGFLHCIIRQLVYHHELLL